VDEKLKEYRDMQRQFYDDAAGGMRVYNHGGHSDNPEYVKTLLMNMNVDSRFNGARVFEFGCGAGRNIVWIRQHAHRVCEVSGCDISAHNVINTALLVCDQAGVHFADPRASAEAAAAAGYPVDQSDVHIDYTHPVEAITETDLDTKLYVSSGMDVGIAPSDHYDVVFSTIVLQHICVHSTRYNIKENIYRILKPGGIFSFQMGFDNPEIATATADKQEGGLGSTAGTRGIEMNKVAGQALYHENKTDASSTNSFNDVRITDPANVVSDLKKIGFVDIEYKITWSWQDNAHEYWIWFKAKKP